MIYDLSTKQEVFSLISDLDSRTIFVCSVVQNAESYGIIKRCCREDEGKGGGCLEEVTPEMVAKILEVLSECIAECVCIFHIKL